MKCTVSYASVTYDVDSDVVYPYAGDTDENAPAVPVQRDLADFDWEDMALLSYDMFTARLFEGEVWPPVGGHGAANLRRVHRPPV